jgi:hypothetical protein
MFEVRRLILLKPVEAGVPGASVALGGGGSPAPLNN